MVLRLFQQVIVHSSFLSLLYPNYFNFLNIHFLYYKDYHPNLNLIIRSNYTHHLLLSLHFILFNFIHSINHRFTIFIHLLQSKFLFQSFQQILQLFCICHQQTFYKHLLEQMMILINLSSVPIFILIINLLWKNKYLITITSNCDLIKFYLKQIK